MESLTPKTEIVVRGVVAVLFVLFALSRYASDSKLSLMDLMMMKPPWCKITPFNTESIKVRLGPEATAGFLFVSCLVLYWSWNRREVEILDRAEEEEKREEAKRAEADMKEVVKSKVLFDNLKCLIDSADAEMLSLRKAVAANNETPGERVGGEVEWALGESSSEEDATREVTGARVRKSYGSSGDPQTEEIHKYLQQH